MDIYEIIKNRRSIRSFQNKPVEEEKLRRILEAASWAPSAGNTQEWRFVIVKDEELRKKLAEAALGQYFIAQAPVVIVICADLLEINLAYGNRGVELYSLLDCGMAAQNLMLTARGEGIGSCAVGAFDEEEVKEILNLGKNIRPVLIIPLGYPAETPKKRPRKPLKDIIKEY